MEGQIERASKYRQTKSHSDTHPHTHMHACTRMHTHMHGMHSCMYAHTHTLAHTLRMHERTPIHTHTPYPCMCTHTHTDICLHTGTRTHTQTVPPATQNHCLGKLEFGGKCDQQSGQVTKPHSHHLVFRTASTGPGFGPTCHHTLSYSFSLYFFAVWLSWFSGNIHHSLVAHKLQVSACWNVLFR